MSVSNFIPVVWAAAMLRQLEKTLVYGQQGIINRDYQGDIRDVGDVVKINALGRVTVVDYTKNSDLPSPETLQDAQLNLVVSQAKAFNFLIDDVDRAQAKPDLMAGAMGEAAYAVADVADQFIAAMLKDVANANRVGTDAAPKTDLGTEAAAYNYLVALKVKLDAAGVPRDGRWAIVPPWFEGLLLKDQRFVSFGTAQNIENLRNGQIGRAAGFAILSSNNVPNTNGAKYKIAAGHPIAWSYAEQVHKVEAYRPEKRFGDAVKGLHLYGGKVVRPDALAVLTANDPDAA